MSVTTEATEPPRVLHRHLSLISAVLLTLSVVTPASSMFIIIPGVISQVGTGVIISLVLAGCLGLVVALVYAELASVFGSAGGEYVYIEKVFGEIPAYPVIVVNLVTLTFITSVLAIGAGSYFEAIIPINPLYTALIVVGFATLFGILNIRTNAFITGLFFFIELAALAAIAYFGLGHASQGIDTLSHPVFLSGPSLTTTPLFAIAMATAAALFAFNGYEQAIYLNEEISGPRSTVGKVILISFVLAILLESAPTVLTLLASNDIARFTDPNVNPYLDLVSRVSGRRGVAFISAAISLAVLNACIANVLMTARFVFSTARSGLWGKKLKGPLCNLSAQRTPVVATLFVGFLGAVACLLPINVLFVLTGTGLVFIYGALCVVIIVHRRRQAPVGEEGSTASFRMPFMPVLPALGLLGLLGVLAANWTDPNLGRPSIIVSLIEIFVGLVIWFFRRKIFSATPLYSDTSQQP